MGKYLAIIFVVLAVLVLGGVYYLGRDQSNNTNNNTPANTNTGNDQSSAQVADVAITNYAFVPSTLKVKAGDTVTWTNNDSVVHTVEFANAKSPNLPQGQKFSLTFTEKGTYPYFCGPHPNMKGNVVVQ